MKKCNMFRSALCLLVVFCLLFQLSPIRAQATGLEIALIGLGAAGVVGTVMIGLGVMPGPDTATFTTAVHDCVEDLTLKGLVVDGMVHVAQMASGMQQVHAVTQEFIEAVSAWMLNSGIVFQGKQNTMISESFGYGMQLDSGLSDFQLWRDSLYLYGLANTAEAGTAFLVASAGSNFYFLFTDGTKLYRCPATSIKPYASTTVPVGIFADFSSVSAFSPIAYLSYDLALQAYQSSSDDYFYYLTEDSRPYITAQGNWGVEYLARINGKTGMVEAGPFGLGAKNTGISAVLPAGFATAEETIITVAPGLTAGVIGNLAEELEVAYPDWVKNAKVIKGSQLGKDNDDDIRVYPVIRPSTLDDVMDLTQEEVWTGGQAETEGDTDTETGSDSSVGNMESSTFLERLGELLWSPIRWLLDQLLAGLQSLFVPTTAQMEGIKAQWDSLLADRFGALYEVAGLITDWFVEFKQQPIQEYIEFPRVTIPLLGSDSFEFGGWRVKVVPDGFGFLIEALKKITDIACTLLFINGLRRRYDRIMEGG